MPDPALLAVLQHFASPPPAIVQPAQVIDAEPFISAFELIADDQDRDLDVWLDKASVVQDRMRASVAVHPDDFSLEMFDDLISRVEQFMRWEVRIAAKRERQGRRRRVSDRLQLLQERTASRTRRRLAAADDLVLFLKAMRAEIDQNSTGGPTFDDPDAIERFILGSAA